MVDVGDEGEPIDCREVVQELYTFLDGELTSTQRVVISRHIDGCVDCHEVAEFHAELRMAIAQKCREQVPDGLRDRIIRSLFGDELQSDAHHGIPNI